MNRQCFPYYYCRPWRFESMSQRSGFLFYFQLLKSSKKPKPNRSPLFLTSVSETKTKTKTLRSSRWCSRLIVLHVGAHTLSFFTPVSSLPPPSVSFSVWFSVWFSFFFASVSPSFCFHHLRSGRHSVVSASLHHCRPTFRTSHKGASNYEEFASLSISVRGEVILHL